MRLLGAEKTRFLRVSRAFFAFFLVLALVFAGRLIWLQLIRGPELAAAGVKERTLTSVLRAPRAKILDAQGKVLADSEYRYAVGFNQKLLAQYKPAKNDPDQTPGVLGAARKLSRVINVPVSELAGAMAGEPGNPSTYYAYLKGLTQREWDAISALKIHGVEPDRYSHRIYPAGNTAGNVVGYYSAHSADKRAGLELQYNDTLRGTPGKRTVERGSQSQLIPGGFTEETPAIPGSDVRTTLMSDLQFEVQKMLDEQVKYMGAQWGAVVVQEVSTGRILAMADSDSVDPGDVGASEAKNRGSRIVTTPYEPGSTGKLTTVAAAIDAGKVTPDTVLTVPDNMSTPNGQKFKDSVPHPTEKMTVRGVLATSSNTGTISVGSQITNDQRVEYMRKFGLGARTGIEMPGESIGDPLRYKKWDGRTRYATMIGQGYSLTLLQNTSVMATLANGGLRQPITLIDAVIDANGKEHVPERPEPVRVVKPETASSMMAMLENVTAEGGTGNKALIPGYRVAGKTGTAQLFSRGGSQEGTATSFVGALPAEKPRVAIGVVMYKPTRTYYAGAVAAPVFAQAATISMRHLSLPPSTGSAPLAPWYADGHYGKRK